jgi:hypothetical protein
LNQGNKSLNNVLPHGKQKILFCSSWQPFPRSNILLPDNLTSCNPLTHVRWVPVTTAWRILGLRMEERPPAMEGSCEYIE